MLQAALLLILSVGCGDDVQPQSVPIVKDAAAVQRRVDVPIRAQGPKPVSMAKIESRWPSFGGLPSGAQEATASVLNLVPAPCESCEFRTIAHCATARPAISCSILDDLFKRVSRQASEGGSVDSIKVSVNYPDFWVEGLGSGSPVEVHLFRDTAGRFESDTAAVENGLRSIFGERLKWIIHEATEDVDAKLGVRSYPTWFVNGHRFRGVQSVNGLARFVEYESMGTP